VLARRSDEGLTLDGSGSACKVSEDSKKVMENCSVDREATDLNAGSDRRNKYNDSFTGLYGRTTAL